MVARPRGRNDDHPPPRTRRGHPRCRSGARDGSAARPRTARASRHPRARDPHGEQAAARADARAQARPRGREHGARHRTSLRARARGRESGNSSGVDGLVTAIAPEVRVEEATPVASQFVQYVFLSVDPQWRRLDQATRAAGRAEFTEAIAAASPDVTTHAYSTLGLKTGAQLMLWWKSADAVTVQDTLGTLLSTGLGRYCEIAHSLWGLTRPSIYTKRRTAQEQAIDET